MLSFIPIPSSRALLHITVSILCLPGVATIRRTQNFTPYGTTNHDEPNALCTPATWIDIASFLLFNYVAHGATVVSYPGEPAFDTSLSVLAAILFPTFGVIRAFNFIIRHPLLTARDDLEVATRSGALCMLVRSPSWKPQKGDNLRNALIEDPGNEHWASLGASNTSRSHSSAIMSPTTAALSIYRPPWLNDKTHLWSYTDTNHVGIGSRAIFGLSEPPDQYMFVFVPRNAEVLPLVDPTPTPSSNVPDIPLLRYLSRVFASPVSTTKLSSSFNLLKGVAALLQLLYASFTLYRTTGGQVEQYGYAAPGFTVLPYAVMSALNLVASLVAPHYPKLYLVRSKVMEEAERRTGLPFHFVVGKVADESGTGNDVMEGWSEIAGSFMDDDEVLNVTHSAEEDWEIKICDDSRQRIYVPACPRFRRTDDTQTSPIEQFYVSETRHGLRLVFPRYMERRQQALMRPSLFSFSRLSSQPQRALRPHINYIRLPQTQPLQRPPQAMALNLYEIFLVSIISSIEYGIIIVLSNNNEQQSTFAQRAWTLAWLMAGCIIGATISVWGRILSIAWKSGRVSHIRLSFLVFCLMVIISMPAIGGFVVVSQMLKAYGICKRFV